MTIAEFMVKLASDPKLLKRFNADSKSRDALLAEHELTGKQRAFLRSGDLRILRVSVEAEMTIGSESVCFQTICGPTIWGVAPPGGPPRTPPSGDPPKSA